VTRALLALALAAAAAGCALKAPPKADDVRGQALPNVTLPQQWADPGGATGAVLNGWLASFQDPQLEALVQEALLHNPDLQVAAARVQQAAAYVKLAGATLYPQVNLLARGGGTMSGDSSGLEGVGVFANWELDLWGRVRAGREAAQLQYVSVALEAEYAAQSLAAMVAKSWFLATEARLQKAAAEEVVRSAERLVGLAQDRQRVGRGDE
jgi:outer membrane protein TolC